MTTILIFFVSFVVFLFILLITIALVDCSNQLTRIANALEEQNKREN